MKLTLWPAFGGSRIGGVNYKLFFMLRLTRADAEVNSCFNFLKADLASGDQTKGVLVEVSECCGYL